MDKTYIFATEKAWHIEEFTRRRKGLPGKWLVVSSREDLLSAIDLFNPRYVFFPHWSYIVESSVLQQVECVCFHMTDVPFGRGGTPLQNLIQRGLRETKLTALRMIDALDAGPVYAKRSLSLEGSALEIFKRAATISFDLMQMIVESEPTPQPQLGEPTVFARRTPEQSALPQQGPLEGLYDHIRMLDAPGYPAAFLRHGPFDVRFSEAELGDQELVARVRISLREGGKGDA